MSRRRNASGIRLRDLLAEAGFGLTTKPMRTFLTTMGIAVGVAALVATVGLAATTTQAVVARFDDLRAREVRAVAADARELSPDLDRRVGYLPGVRSGGILGPPSERPVPVRAFPDAPSLAVPLMPATPGGLQAALASIQGRSLDTASGEVVLVGGDLADVLGVQIRSQPTVLFLGDLPVTVAGIVESVERSSDVLGAIVASPELVERVTQTRGATVLVDVEPGAAQAVAAVLALALRPDDPDAVVVQLMPEARGLRSDVLGELDALGLAISGAVLVVAGLAVAAATMLGVLERRREIGLHRALGARPVHIGLRFLLEAAAVGVFGGIVGVSGGVIAVAVSGSIRDVQPILPLWIVGVAVVVGIAVAVLAGSYPAYRAARLDPIEALRS